VSGLQFVTIVMVCVAGTLVVLTREPLRQVLVAGIFGLLLAILFFTYQAPDVALSQIVIATVAVPIMVLLALIRVRRDADERGDE
jgi:energy-converting hydrogenase B subunit D